MSLSSTSPSPAQLSPALRPERPWFSSGPTAKRPGWSLEALSSAVLGRSNRSKAAVGRLRLALDMTRELLRIPADYSVLCVPASNTGAIETAMWNLLGPRKVQVLSYESFGATWAADVAKQLKIDHQILKAPFGALPDLSLVDPDCDLVFAWNGTTSGVKVPNGDFIAKDRGGLTLCDATSAAFCMDLPWDKLDITTFSFQKALGGEAGLGVLIASPRAIARLNDYAPDRPLPKVLRLRTETGADTHILAGDAINTYPFLVIEDYLDALRWAGRIGGLEGLYDRTRRNFEVLDQFVAQNSWVDFLASDPKTRSETSVCLRFTDPKILGLSEDKRADFVKRLCHVLEIEGVAYDISGYRHAPAGLRIWCGPTVETDDLEALMPWLDYSYQTTLQGLTLA